MRIKFLSVSALADKGYAMMFEDGQVLIQSKREDLGEIVRLGIRKCMMYRLLG